MNLRWLNSVYKKTEYYTTITELQVLCLILILLAKTLFYQVKCLFFGFSFKKNHLQLY